MNPRAIWVVFRFEASRTMTPVRLAVAAALALFPAALLLLTKQQADFLDHHENAALALFILIPELLCIMSLLLSAAPAVYAELEGKTWTYLTISPSGKGSILLGKYFTAVVTTAVTAWISLGLCLAIVRPETDAWRLTAALAALIPLACAAYGALFVLLGVVFLRRAMVAAVAYTFISEVLVAFIPAVINQLTVQFHLRNLLAKWLGGATIARILQNRQFFSPAPPVAARDVAAAGSRRRAAGGRTAAAPPRTDAAGPALASLNRDLDATGLQIIVGSDDLHLAAADHRPQDGHGVLQLFDNVTDIGSYGVIDNLPRLFSGRFHRRSDIIHQPNDMPWGGLIVHQRVHRRLHRTAAFVPQDDNERHVQMPHSVLDAGHRILIRHMTRLPNHEQVPQPFVEEQFRRDTRIGATHDDRERVLAFAEVRSPIRRLMGMLWLPIRKPLVALQKHPQRLVRRRRRGVGLGVCSRRGGRAVSRFRSFAVPHPDQTQSGNDRNDAQTAITEKLFRHGKQHLQSRGKIVRAPDVQPIVD